MSSLRSALHGPLGPYVVLLALALVGVRALPASWPLVGQGPGVRYVSDPAPGSQDVGPPQFVAFPLAAVATGKPGDLPRARAADGSRGPLASTAAEPATALRRGPGAELQGIRHAHRAGAPVATGAERCRLHCVYRL